MSAPEAEGGVRARAQALVARAAEAGLSEAWRLPAHTPREIEAQLRAHAARRRRAAEEADLLGWLAGRYLMLAMHAPRRYPRRPDAVFRPARRMSGEEMKGVFAAMAAGREETDGAG